jgi:hypothetical protein
MKLYTEEQVRQAIKMADKYHHVLDSEENEIVSILDPIELPTDEEMYEKYNAFISTEVTLGFLTKEQGERLKWYYQTYLIKEIQGGNK